MLIMNRIGHSWGALAFAPAPIIELINLSPVHAAIGGLACLSGSSAPDWLEFKIIPHRTITHVLSLWLCVAVYGYHLAYGLTDGIPAITSANSFLGAFLLGFGAGGISHWLGDVLNKQPVPIFTLWDRVAFGLFRSGDHQRLTCLFISVVAWLYVFIRY